MEHNNVHFVTISGHLIDQNGQEYGTKGSGKTYVGRWVKEEIGFWNYHPREWTRIEDVSPTDPVHWRCLMSNLADPLKEACEAIWPSADAKADGAKKESLVDLGGGALISHRALWQLFGTEGVRLGVGSALESRGVLPAGESGTLWARSLVARSHHAWSTLAEPEDVCLVVVVADVRFPDELRTLMDNGGMAHICVKRRVDRDLSKSLDLHPSETSLPLDVVSRLAGDRCFVYDNVDGVRVENAYDARSEHKLVSHLVRCASRAYGVI